MAGILLLICSPTYPLAGISDLLFCKAIKADYHEQLIASMPVLCTLS